MPNYITGDSYLSELANTLRSYASVSSSLCYPNDFRYILTDILSGRYTMSDIVCLRNYLRENVGTGEDISYIASGAFAHYSVSNRLVTTYSFPRCEYIGDYAFYAQPSISTVNFPVCSYIGDSAFFKCYSVLTANLPYCTYIGSYAFCSCNKLTSIDCPVCSYIGGNAFESCSALSSISFSQCNYIGNSAFFWCSSLQTANFPNCTYVGDGAFASCSSIQMINFPSCVYIDRSAFRSCFLIQSASFPVCSYVGDWAFYWCSSLQTVNFPACSYIGNSAFKEDQYLQSVYFPVCEHIDGDAFMNCTSILEVDFPACSAIDYAAFANCGSLQSVNFPACSYINSAAFQACRSLSDISFPVCGFIDKSAFRACNSLQSVYFPACSYISEEAFYSCSSLQTINFPVCNYIHYSVFYKCYSLQTAIFPACSYIGSMAFRYCSSLMSLFLLGNSVAVLQSRNAFSYTPMSVSTDTGSFGSIYVPQFLVSKYKSATNWTYYSNRIVGWEPDNLSTKFSCSFENNEFSSFDVKNLGDVGGSWKSYSAQSYAHSGNNLVTAKSYDGGAYNADSWLTLPPVDLSNCEYAQLKFYARHHSNSYPESLEVWANVGSSPIENNGGSLSISESAIKLLTTGNLTTSYSEIICGLISVCGNDDVYISIRYNSSDKYGVYLDDISIEG